jgi:ABC-type microcin C transport system duplicated ATPase subunit YejF
MIRLPDRTMTKELIERSRKQHGFANVALLMTTAALFVSLVVAVTTVSIGIARADTLGHIAASGSGRFAIAFVLVALIAATGWLTAAMVNDERPQPVRD